MWPVLTVSIGIFIAQAVYSAVTNSSLTKEQKRNWKYYSLIIVLHIIQPIARLTGRIKHGLTPWRVRGEIAGLRSFSFLRTQTLLHWNEAEWKGIDTWLELLEASLVQAKIRVKRGGDFDCWDIKAASGLFGLAKGILTVEEHGPNKQYVKFRYSTVMSKAGLTIISALLIVSILAAGEHQLPVASFLLLLSLAVAYKYFYDAVTVSNSITTGFASLSKNVESSKEEKGTVRLSVKESRVPERQPSEVE